MPRKNVILMALVTALLLLVPLIAMQFTEEVDWNLTDFIIAGILIFSTGIMLDVVMRKVRKNRIPVALGILALFLYLGAELAVGIFTDWGT